MPYFSTVIIPIGPELTKLGANLDLGNIVSTGVNVAIIFAGLAVFGYLIWGGYAWLTAGGDKAKVEEARNRIVNALIGLTIVASAFTLYTIIDKFFGIGNVSSSSGGSIICSNCSCSSIGGSYCNGACTTGGCIPID